MSLLTFEGVGHIELRDVHEGAEHVIFLGAIADVQDGFTNWRCWIRGNNCQH